MRIEEGKFYRAANGGKVGPMKPMGGVFIQEVGDGYSWNPDGTCYAHRARYRSDHHLVAEWTEGPVRTETVQRIEPGVYGLLRVDTYRDQMVVTIDPSDGHQPTAPQMRELARVALEIAEYLDAQ